MNIGAMWYINGLTINKKQVKSLVLYLFWTVKQFRKSQCATYNIIMCVFQFYGALIKNPVKMVVSGLIWCSKFAKNRLSGGLYPDPLGRSLQRSTYIPLSWIVGEVGERGRREEEKERSGSEGKRVSFTEWKSCLRPWVAIIILHKLISGW